MKLDYDLLKRILTNVEDVADGQERHTVTRHAFTTSQIPCESFDVLAYHFDILVRNGFIDGEVGRVALHGHRVTTSIDYFNLTLDGHRLLESMRHQTLWGKIKSQAEALGVAGLNQIPGLAISLLSGNGA